MPDGGGVVSLVVLLGLIATIAAVAAVQADTGGPSPAGIEWCERHGGEVVAVTSGEYHDNHCEFDNGTRVDLDSVAAGPSNTTMTTTTPTTEDA